MADLYKPSSRGMRDPKTNAKENGRIENPPRFPEMGGFKNAQKGFSKNKFGIKTPGAVK